MKTVRFRSGYRHQLSGRYSVRISIRPMTTIKTEFISLNTNGCLTIESGYAWDGATGMIPTKTNKRPSLVHDALYQLLRQEKLKPYCKTMADQEFHRMCLEDGMWRIRAWYAHRALKKLGGPAASPENRKKIYEAP